MYVCYVYLIKINQSTKHYKHNKDTLSKNTLTDSVQQKHAQNKPRVRGQTEVHISRTRVPQGGHSTYITPA